LIVLRVGLQGADVLQDEGLQFLGVKVTHHIQLVTKRGKGEGYVTGGGGRNSQWGVVCCSEEQGQGA
jgi:hypothetical protein